MERIPLSNAAFEGDNNAYLFADGPETVLVDTRDGAPATREQLQSALADRGVGLADIDRVFLTHWHGDHTGLAGRIQAGSGADVYVHTRDAPLVEGDEDAWAAMHKTQDAYFEQWGIPESQQRALRERMAAGGPGDVTPDVTMFEDGETFSFDGRELRVVHTSGHADGLSLFELDGGSEAFTGDALLPRYTPNVGGRTPRVRFHLPGTN